MAYASSCLVSLGPSVTTCGHNRLTRSLRAPLVNVTGEAMPTSLAEALTQLSFLEFLQRCGPLNCSFSADSATSPHFTPGRLLCRPLHPVKSLRMLSTQTSDLACLLVISSTRQCRRFSTRCPHLILWTLPCRRSHTVLFLRTFLRRWVLALLPRFSVDMFVQTPDTQ